ncbi:MAG: DUF3788 domain-containing protein [Acidobacteria bacterium]|nr:DUF3788 domain-containing protein [Acidobacteriota bacterium]
MGEDLKPNAFLGRTLAPSDDELSAALGPTRPLWDQLKAALAAGFGLNEFEWHSYSPKYGWSVRVRKGKRNILYLVPCAGSFRAAFILGGKAVQAARDTKVSARVLRLIEKGKQYPEGRGVQFDVRSARDLAPVEALTRLKLAF